MNSTLAHRSAKTLGTVRAANTTGQVVERHQRIASENKTAILEYERGTAARMPRQMDHPWSARYVEQLAVLEGADRTDRTDQQAAAPHEIEWSTKDSWTVANVAEQTALGTWPAVDGPAAESIGASSAWTHTSAPALSRSRSARPKWSG